MPVRYKLKQRAKITRSPCIGKETQRRAAWLVDTKAFLVVMWVAIIGNVILPCLWTADMQEDYNTCINITTTPNSTVVNPSPLTPLGECAQHPLYINEVLSLFLCCVGVLETFIRILAAGSPITYCRSNWNTIDLVVVVTSTVGVLMMLAHPHTWLADVEEAGMSDVIETFRAIRILRVVIMYKPFRTLFSTFYECVGSIASLGLLYMLITYSFTLVGMALFVDVQDETPEQKDDQRYTFETFGSASLVLFQLSTTNNWNSIIYPVMRGAGIGYASNIFFFMYFSLCATCMLDIVTGIVVAAFQIANEEAHRRHIEQDKQETTEVRRLVCVRVCVCVCVCGGGGGGCGKCACACGRVRVVVFCAKTYLILCNISCGTRAYFRRVHFLSLYPPLYPHPPRPEPPMLSMTSARCTDVERMLP